jgi:hypothetical protein
VRWLLITWLKFQVGILEDWPCLQLVRVCSHKRAIDRVSQSEAAARCLVQSSLRLAPLPAENCNGLFLGRYSDSVRFSTAPPPPALSESAPTDRAQREAALGQSKAGLGVAPQCASAVYTRLCHVGASAALLATPRSRSGHGAHCASAALRVAPPVFRTIQVEAHTHLLHAPSTRTARLHRARPGAIRVAQPLQTRGCAALAPQSV